MVREAHLFADRDPCFEERCEKLRGIADTGKSQNRPIAKRRDHGCVGLKARVEYRDAVALRALDHRRCSVRRADDDDGVCTFDLSLERSPQWTARDNLAVADAAAAVNQQD